MTLQLKMLDFNDINPYHLTPYYFYREFFNNNALFINMVGQDPKRFETLRVFPYRFKLLGC